jgi:hypothetical protein
MDKRISQRTSGKLLAAAVASVGLAGFGASQSHGSLVVDLRATGVTGTGSTVLAGGKSVIASSVGQTVTMGLFARVSGTNGVQYNFDANAGKTDINGDPLPFDNGTANDDTINSLVGSFLSKDNTGGASTGYPGALRGNMALAPGPYSPANQIGGSLPSSPFNSGGQQNGLASDWDSDGDIDIGATGTDPTNLFAARAANPTSAAFAPGNGKGWAQGTSYGANPAETLIDANTGELRLGILRFIITAVGGTTGINFIPRDPGADPAGIALWFEDGSSTGKTPGNASFTVTSDVLVNLVPEPASAGLLGLASLGLLARRRKP